MFNRKHHGEIRKRQKKVPLHFPFHIKMKVNRGVVVVGDSGAVLQCIVKDIPIYLGQKLLRNSVLCD